MTDAYKPDSSAAPDICIYHSPCADGFAAAWAVWKRWPDVQFVAAAYGDTPPDVSGKHVLIVDFSYKLRVLEIMGETSASITILDHHKSAEADLRPFAVGELAHPSTLADLGDDTANLPVQALFDMTRSGAMMAWAYCHGDAIAPLLIQYVQDRDLWRFDLHFSREIAASLFSHDYDFRVWDEFSAALETDDGFRTIVAEGSAIERKHRKDVDELLGLTCRYMVIGGHRVPVANIPYTMASDAANQLAEGNAFAACYYDNADGRRVFSLRSKPEGLDVSVVAAAYGGGGHTRAAGFSMPCGWEGGASDEDDCPICKVRFTADDLCLTDIDLGTCHAECLAESPAVDLFTGEPLGEGEPLPTPYRYDTFNPKVGANA